MKYRDISTDRLQLPASHPFLAEISFDPLNWHLAQSEAANDPAIRILGYDQSRGVLFVACAARAVKDRLQDDWSAV